MTNNIRLRDKLRPGIRPLPPGVAFTHPWVLVATWFGAGRLRPASGTVGSVAAMPFGYLIYYFGGIAGLALAALLLLWTGTRAASWYGRKSGNPDDQAIVADEVVGVWIAALPAEHDWRLWLSAFVLFRVMDVYKPWPASFFEKRKGGGFDAMMDDVVAGVYAMLGVAAAAVPGLLKI